MSNIMDGCSATFDEMSKLLDEQNDGYVKSTGFVILSVTYRTYNKVQILLDIFQITDTVFWLIGPHECDAEIHIDRKVPSAMGDSGPGLTSERPVFYHYTNNFPTDNG